MLRGVGGQALGVHVVAEAGVRDLLGVAWGSLAFDPFFSAFLTPNSRHRHPANVLVCAQSVGIKAGTRAKRKVRRKGHGAPGQPAPVQGTVAEAQGKATWLVS